jgi:hypothetical protein
MERKVLNSWKEISSYMGRGVRTVQRYELQFALPVHRPAGSACSSVIAFSDELDRWLRQSPTRSQQLEKRKSALDGDDSRPRRLAVSPSGQVCPLCFGTGKMPAHSAGAADARLSVLPANKQRKVMSA